ncbi:MAG TPA: DUF6249 domain-containing protein [Phenylobacterium sp.]|uniref:DUF6249 domain-containing protein n=1 Tax=Phenylobacterium sp. TaxID=1871053 RepID=UPI002CD546F8|nr:DUF6249 domain-containing protein [Phenylobacterium sp.]HSV03229.1 DUF6249 domain-containing protein [Phenylobacterium sp.]
MILLIIFGSITAMVIAPMYFRSQERQRMMEMMRISIEKGEPMPENVTEAISRTARARLPPSPQRDLRTGIIWLGVGVGLAAMGVALNYDDPDATWPMIGIACFPAFIGIAFIVMYFLNRGRD